MESGSGSAQDHHTSLSAPRNMSDLFADANDSDDDGDAPFLVALNETTLLIDAVDASLEGADDTTPAACPVTILSGFLGSGKTTLIQYILKSPDHGRKIAVIENEFGDGLDVESMIARDGSHDNASLQELIELPNGCICCTVKDSLVSCLENLIEKRKDLDYILIECSGMANPGPIASLFWLDDALESRLRLDGIVTMVDAKHVLQQLRETEEAAQQIAFADRILINKTDLVESTGRVRTAIQAIHPTASMRETTFSMVPDLEWILDANFYSVDRLEDLERATKAADLEDDHHDHSHEHHSHSHDHDHEASCSTCYATEHRHTSEISTISLIEADTVDLKRLNQWLASVLWPDQDEQANVDSENAHDNEDVKDLETSHTKQLGQRIFRIKGILSVKNLDDHDEGGDTADSQTRVDLRRHIVQAVHDLWEISPASDNLKWRDDEERVCKLVVIGRRLDEERLREGFSSCFQ